MKLLVATAAQKLFDGEADAVSLPTAKGEIQILPGHTYLVTSLGAGTVAVTEGGREQRFEIAGGIAEISDDRVVALAT